MTVVGPNGKDIYAVAVSHRYNSELYTVALMVEALSKDEAYGMVHRMTRNLKGKTSIYVTNFVGFIDFTEIESMRHLDKR